MTQNIYMSLEFYFIHRHKCDMLLYDGFSYENEIFLHLLFILGELISGPGSPFTHVVAICSFLPPTLLRRMLLRQFRYSFAGADYGPSSPEDADAVPSEHCRSILLLQKPILMLLSYSDFWTLEKLISGAIFWFWFCFRIQFQYNNSDSRCPFRIRFQDFRTL